MVAAITGLAQPLKAQELSVRERDRAEVMLRTIEREIQRRYYDTTFAGIDLRAHFAAARERLAAARTNSDAFVVIAQALLAFNDSHLYFIPPERAAEVRYRWGLAMIGDNCYVAAVDSAGEAARLGVRIGDRVIAVDSWRPVRRDFWKLEYLLRALAPRTEVTLRLESPGGTPRELRVPSRVRERRRVVDLTGSDGGADLWDLIRRQENAHELWREEFVTVDDSTLIWRMPSFVVEDEAIDDGIRRARRHRNLILDLRGNAGGYESALTRLVGRVLAHDIHIGELRRRDRVDTMRARSRGDVFSGRMVVLVDQRSASASELFARVIQLEQRGTIIGDRTAGAVMRSQGSGLAAGGSGLSTSFYGLSITDADIVMSDGGTLEVVGVRPDEVILPSGADLAAGRDPVLARALQVLGHNVDAARAGRLMSRRSQELNLW